MARKMPETNICGACTFCRVDSEQKEVYLCWVSPPMVVGDSDDYTIVRGIPVEITDTKCIYYQPRHNA